MQNVSMERQRQVVPFRVAFAGDIQHVAFYLQMQRVVEENC
jgi:hypothetical protein